MLPRLTRRTTATVVLGLTVCALAFGSSYLVGEARPLLQTAPTTLGTAKSFGVLAGSTITNTGATVVNADLGLSPGTAVTGFPPGAVVNGTIHAADGVALQAQTDTTTAYNVLAGQACPSGNDLTGQDLGAKTLVPGVYCFSTSAQLTGALTLNAQGNSASVFVFKIGTTLTTATGSSVVPSNPGAGSMCNVFWQVGSSATIGTTTQFLGNIVALTSITLNTGANVNGRALARNGAVTMDTNTITLGGCAVGLSTVVPAAATAAAATATAAAAATATTAGAATATASFTNTPAPQSKPPNTRTPTPVPATETAVPTVTRTATATLPPVAVAAATQTPIPAAAAAAAAAPASAPVAQATPTALVANSSVSAQAGATPGPANETTPTPLPVAQVAPPAQVPVSLPRTGGGLPPLGLLSVLLGGLAVAVGLTVRRTRR